MLRYFTQVMVWLATVFAVLTFVPVVFGQGSQDPISVVKYTLDNQVNNQLVVNQCNGETVTMNGTMHFEYFYATDADGDRTAYHISSTSRLTGIGQVTGAKYVANDSVSQTVITRDVFSDTTMTLKSRLVAQGPTPDMLLRQLLHVVVDNKGDIKADVVKNNVTCR